MVEFDAAVTAPVFGHATVWDYYNTASSTHSLPDIKTPLLILHALDDPIACMSIEFNLTIAEVAIPWDAIAANEYTILAYTHRGGHLGWFMWGGKRWFVTAVGDFFELIEKTLASQ
jgi:predicted alpha/beta-fold hydrolase